MCTATPVPAPATTVPAHRRTITCPVGDDASLPRPAAVEGQKRRRHSWNGTDFHQALVNNTEPLVAFQQTNTSNDDTVLVRMRKAGVALAGGTMVGVGLVMIPLPTPFGAVIAASGMSVLGTEFPAAQRVLESGKSKVNQALESKEFKGFVAQSKVAMDSAGAKIQKELPKAQRIFDKTMLAVCETMDDLLDTVPHLREEEKKEEHDDFEDSWCNDISMISSSFEDDSEIPAPSSRRSNEVIFSSIESSELFGSTRRPIDDMVDVWNA